jgi:hypothetical protein
MVALGEEDFTEAMQAIAQTPVILISSCKVHSLCFSSRIIKQECLLLRERLMYAILHTERAEKRSVEDEAYAQQAL